MLDKVKLWVEKTGMIGAAWLAIAAAAWVLMGEFYAGAALGIFVYINFNVIKKIVMDQYNKLV
ncbi:hypothetical protein PP178_03965 [Zeaxanthinibacter sp. PT1]|uniref:hypothetical protein n=1 Tax=Zeaxanthinibacter TaxID=561554 RepID=UPI00234A785E|nr:hypothetical protein [Zeaxanthinibacter sp. PT1]MDC6350696.1 hypothetical protein [Zeaxanthinibacter sp. PT1]